MIYRSFLYINLLSFNLRIMLYSNYNTDESMTLDLIPIELLSQNDLQYFFYEKIKKSYSQPYAVLISKNLHITDPSRLFDIFFMLGATAIIVEDSFVYNDSRAIYTINSNDIKHLVTILANVNKSKDKRKDKSEDNSKGKDKIIKNTRISNEYHDAISLIDEFFLQIPPILSVVLFVIIWKTFGNDEEYNRRNFYYFEDFVDSVNISCQGTFCCICFDEYRESDEIRKLGCKHYFHKHCIQSWLARSNICPVCRVDVFRTQHSYQNEVTFI
ncbi:hypothetical protein BDAP_000824 [Binucleata daphniae]